MAYFDSERVIISSIFAHQAGNVPSVTDVNRFVVVVVGFTFFETNEVGFFSPQKNRVKDFREAIIKYLEAMMESQQQVCKI